MCTGPFHTCDAPSSLFSLSLAAGRHFCRVVDVESGEGRGRCWRGRWLWGPGPLPPGAAGLSGPAPQGDAGEIVGVASTQGVGLTQLLAALAPRTGVSHAQRGLVSLGVWLGEDR